LVEKKKTSCWSLLQDRNTKRDTQILKVKLSRDYEHYISYAFFFCTYFPINTKRKKWWGANASSCLPILNLMKKAQVQNYLSFFPFLVNVPIKTKQHEKK